MSAEEVRKQAAIDAEARELGIPAWQLEMSRSVGTDAMSDIVRDFRKGVPERSGFGNSASSVPTTQGNGWVNPKPLSPPPGISIMDAMVDVQDRIDRAARAEQFAKAGIGCLEKKTSE